MFIKTLAALVPEVIEAVRPLHPYSIPCFLTLPIDDANKDYLAWARGQLR